ncbi:TrgA family protein [Vannielia sp.]|uniref:TrgA family protein n=1 Tax=Vannielia sp. TaxID=2813045 RepID=UPI00260D38E0|nr:TrgA family protein [Vannielia sp.]MDF1873683.1 TrgA family protein [Vannielia sp.]
MPTATKLISGLVFALLAFFASEIYKPLLPEGTQSGLLSYGNAIIGFLCGWMVMGRLGGRGIRAAMGAGVRTALAITAWALLFWAIWKMLVLSTRPGAYAGPVDAINGAFGFVFDYGLLMLSDPRLAFTIGEGQYFVPQVPLLLVVGGMLCGWVAEWVEDQSKEAGQIGT